jgi:hypothetical protein
MRHRDHRIASALSLGGENQRKLPVAAINPNFFTMAQS